MNGLAGLELFMRASAQWLYDVAVANGFRPRVTSVVRSYQDQLRLYQHNPSGLPVARPGTSKHEIRRAFDMIVQQGRNSPEQAWLGQLWESMGGRWGGRFRDPVHFEG